MTFQSILFPVDFSERSGAAAPFVLSIAQRHKARVVAFHAIQPSPLVYAGMDALYPETYDFEGIASDLKIELQRFVEEQLPKVDVTCEVQIGDPARTIVEYASAQEMSLIALPTHGYGLFRRALLGSVTTKVLHDSALPVWTSAHAPEPSHRAHPKPRHILCALDLKPGSRQALEMAIGLAIEAEAKLELVHVPADGVPADSVESRAQRLLIEAAGRDLANIDEGEVDETQMKTETGRVADLIRERALQKRSDLIVIGRGHIRSSFGSVHSNSYAIIREAPCPVLSV